MRARRRKAGGGRYRRGGFRRCEDAKHQGFEIFIVRGGGKVFAGTAVGVTVAGFKGLDCRSRTVPASRRDRRWVAVCATALGVVEAVVFVDPYVARRPHDLPVETRPPVAAVGALALERGPINRGLDVLGSLFLLVVSGLARFLKPLGAIAA